MAAKKLTQHEQKLEKAIRAVRRKRYEMARSLLADVIEADPRNESAWMWLARASEDPAKRAQCLQRVLAINPDNGWAADELQKGPSLPGTPSGQAASTGPTATGVFENQSASTHSEESRTTSQKAEMGQGQYQLKSLACPNCGASSTLRGGDATQAFVCPFCSSNVDLTQAGPTVVDKRKRRMRPGQPIEPGMEGRFDGRLYQVIGWLRYEGWDDEDRWRWDEWQMLAEDGGVLWLSYDDEAGFALGRKIEPTDGFDPARTKKIPVPGGSVRVKERYPAKVIGLGGELTWRAKVDNRLEVAEGTRGSSSYTLEYVPNRRLDLYASQKQKAQDIWTAFGRTDILQEAKSLAWSKGRKKLLAFICAAFAVVSLLAAPFLAAAGQEVSSGTVQLQKGVGNDREMEPFTIDTAGRATRIELKSSPLPTNSWAVVDVTLYDDDDVEHYLAFEEFWDEAGRDSDGPWHERDLSGSTLFRTATPGTYQLELVMEEASTNVSSISVDVRVIHNVWMVRYLVFAALLAGLGAVFFIWNINQKTSRGSHVRLID